jgi:hypothetical protein
MNVETIGKTFSCPDTAKLYLSNIRGSVRIQAGDINEITLTADKHLDTGDDENTQIELTQSSDGLVKVETRYNRNGFWFFNIWPPCKVDYRVSVPKDCALKVRGVSNSAWVEGTSRGLDLATVSGDVEIRSLSGELKLKSVSGDVLGEAISGSTHLNTVSGDIKLSKSDIPALKGKTVSGDLLVETPLGDGSYDFKSVSGDVELHLSSKRGVTVTSSSLSGKIRTSLASSDTYLSRNHRQVKIAGGGVEIHHNSVSGDIFLVRGTEVSALMDGQDTEITEKPSQKRTDILDQIGRGELSVDQALQILAGDSPA